MKNFVTRTLLAAAVLLSTVSVAFSQGKGNLRGKVTDESGGTLPGASVVVKGTTLGTATDINGSFLLQGIKAGEALIRVDYLGYDSLIVKVKIVAGETVNADFKLKQLSTQIQGVTVSAVVDGQQRALNQQKAADNVMQVLSADQMGRFPDLNVAEALQRISGVTISRSRGEGSEAALRGTPAGFTNISVNGEQIMGTGEGGARNESLDVIPSDILSSMEVQKTLLPSNDGDAIAGVINMRTGTARSLKPKFMLDASTGYNVLRDKMPYNFKGGYSQRYGANSKNPGGRFGIAANASYYRSNNGYDALEAQVWMPKNIVDKDGKVVEEGVYLPTDFRYRYQQGIRSRIGGSVAFDYAPNLNTKFILSAIYNNRHDQDTRYRNRYRLDKAGKYTDMGDGAIAPDALVGVIQTTDQDIEVNNLNLNLDGESVIGTWKVDGGVFFTTSKKEAESAQYGFQTPKWQLGKQTVSGGKENIGKKIPKDAILGILPSYATKYLTMTDLYQPTDDGSNIFSDQYYELYTLDNNNVINKGQNVTGRLNAEKNYFVGSNASTFSFGAKGKFMHNERYKPSSANILDISNLGTGDNALTNFIYKQQLSSNFLDGHLQFGPAASTDKLHDFYAKNPDRFKDNPYRTGAARDSYYYDAQENIVAGYVMNKIQFRKLMAIVGVRIENTSVDYKANKVFRYNADVVNDPANTNKDIHWNGGQTTVPDPETGKKVIQYNAYESTPGDSTLSYTMILPNIQFKWDVTNHTIFRLAYTTGYSRPTVASLMPTIDFNTDQSKLVMGNPNLKAAYAHNLDFLFEHYLKSVGLISGGFFYKHINNFQYISEGLLTDKNSPYWSDIDPVKLIQQRNGQNAKVYGAEVTLNSNLSFLPGFLKNMVFTSNYTYTQSKAKTSDDRDALRFPGQADHTANIALAYSSKRLTLQASANYNGSFISALGANSDEDIWMDARWQLDLNGSFKILPSLTFYAEAVNVLNSPAFTYMGNTSRVYELQYTSPVVRFGFTYRF